MGEISPPTTADYAFAASSENRNNIAEMRAAIGLLTKLLVENGALTKEQGAQIAQVIRSR